MLLLLLSSLAFAADDWTFSKLEEDPQLVTISRGNVEKAVPLAVASEKNAKFTSIFLRENGPRDLWAFLKQPEAEKAADEACKDVADLETIPAFSILDPVKILSHTPKEFEKPLHDAAIQNWEKMNLSQKVLAVTFGGFLYFNVRENQDAPAGFEISSAVVSCRDRAGERVRFSAMRGLVSVLSIAISRLAVHAGKAEDPEILLFGLRKINEHISTFESYLNSKTFKNEVAHLQKEEVAKNIDTIKKTTDLVHESLTKIEIKARKPRGRSIASQKKHQIGLTGAQINKIILFYR